MTNTIRLAFISALSIALVTGCEKSQPPPAQKAKAARPPKPVAKRIAKPSKTAPSPNPGTVQYLDYNNGFRNLVFGQQESSMTNLVLKFVDATRQLRTYALEDDALVIEGTPLKSIEYSFFKGRLFQVRATWQRPPKTGVLSIATPSGVATTCSSLYGRPKHRSARQHGEVYIWRGKEVALILNEIIIPGVPDSLTGGWAIPPVTRGSMVMESLPLRKEMQLLVASAKAQSPDGL